MKELTQLDIAFLSYLIDCAECDEREYQTTTHLFSLAEAYSAILKARGVELMNSKEYYPIINNYLGQRANHPDLDSFMNFQRHMGIIV